jgi:hypothetical protein
MAQKLFLLVLMLGVLFFASVISVQLFPESVLNFVNTAGGIFGQSTITTQLTTTIQTTTTQGIQETTTTMPEAQQFPSNIILLIFITILFAILVILIFVYLSKDKMRKLRKH